MDHHYYLIVAKYNHKSYKDTLGHPSIDVTKQEARTEKQIAARAKAVELFGRNRAGSSYGAQSKETGKANYKLPTYPWSEKTAFLGAFPYYLIPANDPNRADKQNEYLYGWVAIVPQIHLQDLLNNIGYPTSEFCQVFDIHISQIGQPDFGSQELNLEERIDKDNNGGQIKTPLKKDKAVWDHHAIKVYYDHTPAMWQHQP